MEKVNKCIRKAQESTDLLNTPVTYPIKDVFDLGSVKLKFEKAFTHLVYCLVEKADIFALRHFPAYHTRRPKGVHQTVGVDMQHQSILDCRSTAAKY